MEDSGSSASSKSKARGRPPASGSGSGKTKAADNSSSSSSQGTTLSPKKRMKLILTNKKGKAGSELDGRTTAGRKAKKKKREEERRSKFVVERYPDIFEMNTWTHELARLVLEEFQIKPVQTAAMIADATQTREEDVTKVLNILASTPILEKCVVEGTTQVAYRYPIKVQPITTDIQASKGRVQKILQELPVSLTKQPIDPDRTPHLPLVMDVSNIAKQKLTEQRHIRRIEYRIARLASEMQLPTTKRKPLTLMRELMHIDPYARNDDLYTYVVRPRSTAGE